MSPAPAPPARRTGTTKASASIPARTQVFVPSMRQPSPSGGGGRHGLCRDLPLVLPGRRSGRLTGGDPGQPTGRGAPRSRRRRSGRRRARGSQRVEWRLRNVRLPRRGCRTRGSRGLRRHESSGTEVRAARRLRVRPELASNRSSVASTSLSRSWVEMSVRIVTASSRAASWSSVSEKSICAILP